MSDILSTTVVSYPDASKCGEGGVLIDKSKQHNAKRKEGTIIASPLSLIELFNFV